MLKLFEPQSKIQKDREIIRDTDMRMAKYSRRGLVSIVLMYPLCLLIEQNFVQLHPHLAIVLAVGLLFTTAVRGYLLFRMNTIYPRAPASWRNKYFIATLFGAFWWGFILSCVTLLMDMQGEAMILWLFTVVFFSTTAHAFAPYQRFLSIYQFLGIVPAACCTFFIGDFIGVFYGCFLLFYYWILNHHCELIAHNYWDRMEAHFVLARKAESIEEERRGSIATAQLTNDYLQLLGQEMANLLGRSPSIGGEETVSPVTAAGQRSAFEKIYRNVDDFCRAATKDINVQSRVFNIRHYLQSLVQGMVEEAECKGIELETALSPALPSRLRGDPKRIGQIVTSMVKSTIQQSHGGLIFVEVEFIREFEEVGQLHVTIARQSDAGKRLFFQNGSESDIALDLDLDLILAKALAEAMSGRLEVNEPGVKSGKNLRLRLPVKIAEKNAPQDYHQLQYNGRPLLLIHQNPRWLDHKRLELDAMGFAVQTTTNFRKAVQALTEAVDLGRAVECVVYYAASGDEQPVQFCNELLGHGDLKYVHQLVVCSDIGRKFFSDRIAQIAPSIHFVSKPASIYEFEISTSGLFDDQLNDMAEQAGPSANRVIWLGAGQTVDHLHPAGIDLDIQYASETRQLYKLLEGDDYRLIVVESTGEDESGGIAAIRTLEQKRQRDTLAAIVGVGPEKSKAAMLEAGADHFIDVESLVLGKTPELNYWIKGRNH